MPGQTTLLLFGYRITEAYYARAGANEQAVHDILNVTDYAGFLERSGYDPGRP